MFNKFKLIISSIILISTITGASMNSYAQTELPTRDKIDNKYKWNLSDIYTNDNAWQIEFSKLNKELESVSLFKGKISSSAKELLVFLNLTNELEAKLNKLFIYASLGKDIDLNDASFKSMFDKSQSLVSGYSSATAFFVPELMTISDDKINDFYRTEKGLDAFRQKLTSIFLLRKNTLTEKEEKLMAELYPVFVIPGNTYNTLNDAELPFPKIKDSDGNEIQVSHGRYRAGLYSQDRNYRHDIYKATYVPYDMLKGTMSELYIGRATQRMTNAKIRNYSSAVEASLKPNNIPMSVYENLVKVTNANLKTQHRWGTIKKKVLKLDELHPYDTYVSLFPSVNKSYSYDEAVEICKKALAPLGEEYLKAMDIGFHERWIDVFETKAKRSGAYSNSSGAGPHPFILLNWNNTLDDVFTLIHELGHNMHSYFTEKTQPFHYRDYATFVAEVASTANEALLFEYLLKNAASKEEKLMLYEKFLTSVQTTYFRQTEFAEFEKNIHDRMEAGETFNADKLTEEFAKLYQIYWGPEMKTDYEEGLSWARIPHLMRYNFYVYQYATGFAAAFALTENIKKEGKPAIDRYLNFLSSGSSKYPIDILKDAGVDMTKVNAIMALINTANKYLDELESLIK